MLTFRAERGMGLWEVEDEEVETWASDTTLFASWCTMWRGRWSTRTRALKIRRLGGQGSHEYRFEVMFTGTERAHRTWLGELEVRLHFGEAKPFPLDDFVWKFNFHSYDFHILAMRTW